MKNHILIFISFFGFQIVQAQSETSLVEKTLANYIEGSSYNKLDVLEGVYTKNATLYLSGKEGFKRYTPKEYVAFFKNKKYGEFNGQFAKILGIEVIKDIATAKVEIAIPARKMKYIDLFLLKKIDGEWKIISKTATRVDETSNN